MIKEGKDRRIDCPDCHHKHLRSEPHIWGDDAEFIEVKRAPAAKALPAPKPVVRAETKKQIVSSADKIVTVVVRDRAKYNAYQREYQKKRRAEDRAFRTAAKESGK